jgi:hypothetical protein
MMQRTPIASVKNAVFSRIEHSPLVTRLRKMRSSVAEASSDTATAAEANLPLPESQSSGVEPLGNESPLLIEGLEPVTICDEPEISTLPATPADKARATRLMAEIESSLPRPLTPTPAKSPPQSQSTTPPSGTDFATCPVCEEEVNDKKGVMCNFCKYWHHRTCLHPQFFDRDITAVKKDFVILICCKCYENAPMLISQVVERSNTAKASSSESVQCEILQVPENMPLVDQATQVNRQEENMKAAAIPISPEDADDDVVMLEDTTVHVTNQSTTEEASECHRSAYYVIRGIDDPCSNLYEFDFTYNDPETNKDRLYSSLEQAYKYTRILPHDQVTAKEILQEHNPYHVMALAKKCPQGRSEEDINLMEKMVQAKVHQCRAFRDAMRRAKGNNLRFIHSTYPTDNVFGSGLRHDEDYIPKALPGQNLLGKMVESCAASLLPENEYPASSTSYRTVNGITIILRDGEKLPYAMRSRQYRSTGRPVPAHERNSPWNRHTHHLPDAEPTATVNPPPRHQPRALHRGNHICFHCAVPGHTKKECRLRHIIVICRRCGREGHKQKYCVFNLPNLPTDQQRRGDNFRRPQPQHQPQGQMGPNPNSQTRNGAPGMPPPCTLRPAVNPNMNLYEFQATAPNVLHVPVSHAYVYRPEHFPPLPPPSTPTF